MTDEEERGTEFVKRTAAIVVTYNRKTLLMENIQSLLAQRPEVPDILIVDNHSTDGTKDALEQYIQNGQVFYYDTGANLGGAGGFQYGIRKAAEAGYEYLWIMDDDCMPQFDALDALRCADAKLKGNYGFLSSKVLWKDHSLCTMNIQRHPLTKNIKDFSGDIVPATLASFVSLLVKRSVVMELGLPIREFFIWTDDWEYTRRISLRYPCYVVTGSVVIHKSASNIGAEISSDSIERLDRYRYLYRNDVYLYRREGLRGFVYEVARLGLHIMRVLLKSRDHRAKRIGMILAGTWEGLHFKPSIEYVKEAVE